MTQSHLIVKETLPDIKAQALALATADLARLLRNGMSAVTASFEG